MESKKEAVLRRIVERGGPEGLDLSGQDLAGADLSGFDLHGVSLARADLRKADLRGANLRGADLSRAILQGADLRWADLSRADLRWADMRNASLQGAELDGTNMEGADLTGADLTVIELTREARREESPVISRQRKSRILTTLAVVIFALALADLICVWGWLYKASYLDEFGLSWGFDLNLLSFDYLLRGGQVLGLSLGFLLMLLVFFLYVLLMLAVIAFIFLVFVYLGDRIVPGSGASWMSRVGMGILFLACLAGLILIFPRLISLGGWLIEGILAREGFQTLKGFLFGSSVVEKALFVAFLAAFLVPLWILYRLFCQGLQRVEAPFPWLRDVLAFVKRSRLVSLFHPLTPWERRLGVLAVVIILIAIPTFLTQSGRLHAQADMCDGGSLPVVTLYEKGLLETSSLRTEEAGERFCLRLLLTREDNYYVFYPHQTREVEGRWQPSVYEIPAEEVDLIKLEESTACLTCEDEVSSTEEPPIIVYAAATPTPTPTEIPTETPTGAPTEIPTEVPTEMPTVTSTPEAPTATPMPAPPTATFTPQVPVATTTPVPPTATATMSPPPTPTPIPPTATNTPTAEPTPTETGCGDQYEPDDIVGQQEAIALGETQTHSFCPEGDFDLVWFPVKKERWYHVYTHELAMGVDTMISVGLVPTIARYCNPPNCANDDIAPGNLASDIVFQADVDGTALVSIDNRYQHGPDKTYQITVEEIVHTPTPTPSVTTTPSITPTPTRTSTPTNTPTITTTPSPTPGYDLYESNNSFSTAFPIASGETYSAYINPSQDVDYFKFDIHTSNTITAKLTSSDPGKVRYSLSLYFYDGDDWNILDAKGNTAGEESVTIAYDPEQTGKYIVKVSGIASHFDPSKSYKLRVIFDRVPTPTPLPTSTPTPTSTATQTPTPTPTLTPIG